MKKKKWRVLAIIAGVVALFAVGVVFYSNREHADYVRAAKLLPTARREAEAMFGPLTWEEYRAENGITVEDDLSKWEDVAATIPRKVKALYETYPSPGTERAVFIAERDWFDQIGSQLEELRVMHVPMADGEFSEYSFGSPCREIAKALWTGILGAAEEGDAEAVLAIARASNSMIAKMDAEPAVIHHLITHAMVAMFDGALLRSAVKYRSNPAVLKSIRTVLDERPRIPAIGEVLSAEARSKSIHLQHLRKLSPYEINEWLNDYAGSVLTAKTEPPLLRFLYDAWERVSGERRQTGKQTAAALEARYWKVLAEYAILFERLVANEPGARKEIVALAAFMENTLDRSYEIAPAPYFSLLIDGHIKFGFGESALRAAVELIERYPVHADVPNALPSDLSFADPFGGDPIIFRKTARGFLIYSRFTNEIDDGFPVDYPDQLGEEARFAFAFDRKDYGLIVSYDPNTPVP
ncbi:MAG: hypothetical protein IH944_12815 [Armatimonadetes bacterium]|nr:hypothetical protein [Armatimonadota bacterium]